MEASLGTPEIMGIVTVVGAVIVNMIFVMVKVGKREEVIDHHSRNHVRHYMLSDKQEDRIIDIDKRVALLEDIERRREREK